MRPSNSAAAAASRPDPISGPNPASGPDGVDRGSATVLLLAVTALVATVAAAALAVGVVAERRQRAATAADLAVLAAAVTAPPLAFGGTVELDIGCQRAASVAAANGARLVSCHGLGDPTDPTDLSGLSGLSDLGDAGPTAETAAPVVGGSTGADPTTVEPKAVEVTVAVDLPGALARFGPVLVRARAG